MTATAEAQQDAGALEPIEGGCPACHSTLGAYWGSCAVCGCPTPARQLREAGARALAFGAITVSRPGKQVWRLTA